MSWLFPISFLLLISGQRGPQFYYWNGKQLEALKKIELPNLGSTSLRFFVRSPYELEAAQIDSVSNRICLPDSSDVERFCLIGRWYVLLYQTRLTVGVSQHVLAVRTVGGKTFLHKFLIAVEGAMRMEHLHINH
ncbi:MAG: hypothetical protein ACP5US_06695 [Candidatus Kryptoniota bacterium]